MPLCIFFCSMMRAADIQILALLTRSKRKVSDTQVTIETLHLGLVLFSWGGGEA